MEIKAGPYA